MFPTTDELGPTNPEVAQAPVSPCPNRDNHGAQDHARWDRYASVEALVLGILGRDDLVHAAGILGGEQASAKVGILEDPTDAGERLEVCAG